MKNKTFKNYLAESERTYNYRIKIVGDVSNDWLNQLKAKLKQFDPVTIGAIKSTPMQLQPADFPAFKNDSVSSMDVEFRYPAIEPQIKQIAQLLFLDPNRIIMLTTKYEEDLDTEKARIEKENKDLLTDTDYPSDTAEQKELVADYSAAPEDHAVLKNSYRSSFEIAGGKTPAPKTTNDFPMGDKSPMTNVKRPPKPATGAQPRG